MISKSGPGGWQDMLTIARLVAVAAVAVAALDAKNRSFETVHVAQGIPRRDLNRRANGRERRKCFAPRLPIQASRHPSYPGDRVVRLLERCRAIDLGLLPRSWYTHSTFTVAGGPTAPPLRWRWRPAQACRRGRRRARRTSPPRVDPARHTVRLHAASPRSPSCPG